jgi:hypothetical protein
MSPNASTFEDCCRIDDHKGLGRETATMHFFGLLPRQKNECPPSNQQVLAIINDLDESLIIERQSAMSVTRE